MFDAYTERMDLKVQRIKSRLVEDIRALEERVARLEKVLGPVLPNEQVKSA